MIFPTEWRQQPKLWTPINRAHPLAPWLVCAYNPALGPKNLVNGRPATITTSPTIIGRDGMVMCRDASLVFPGVQTPPPLTIHTIQLFQGSGLSDRIGGVNGSGSGWRYELTSNAVTFTFGGVANYGSTGYFSDGAANYDIRGIGVTCVSTATASGSVKFYNNGILQDTLSSGSYVSSATDLDIADSVFSLFLLFNKALSDQEVAILNANPWSLFTPLSDIFVHAVSGGSTDVTVNPTGVSATGSVGTPTVTGTAVVSPTGVSATGSVGTVSVTLLTSVPVTGVSATGSVGTVSVTGGAVVNVTGVSATGQVGDVVAGTVTTVNVTGVSASGAVGDVSVSGGASVSPTGVSAMGSVGTVSVAAGATVSPTGVSTTGQVGDVTVSTDGSMTVNVTGVSATGSVGTVSVITPSLKIGGDDVPRHIKKRLKKEAEEAERRRLEAWQKKREDDAELTDEVTGLYRRLMGGEEAAAQEVIRKPDVEKAVREFGPVLAREEKPLVSSKDLIAIQQDIERIIQHRKRLIQEDEELLYLLAA